jgi:hypothetical protein
MHATALSWHNDCPIARVLERCQGQTLLFAEWHTQQHQKLPPKLGPKLILTNFKFMLQELQAPATSTLPHAQH